MITQENITVVQRVAAPTPKLFKKLRRVSWVLLAVGGALVATPVLPVVATIGAILTTAGTVGTALSSLPVDFEELDKKQAQPLD